MNRHDLDVRPRATRGSESFAARPPLDGASSRAAHQTRGHIRRTARPVPARPKTDAAAGTRQRLRTPVDSSEQRR